MAEPTLVTVTSSGECVCAWCGEAFEPPHTRGPTPKYCSRAHRQRAHESRQAQQRAVDAEVAELTARRALEASRAFDDIRRFATFDAAALPRDVGSAATLTKQIAEMQKAARGAMTFDAAAILRDVGSAATLTKQIAEIQKAARGAMTFDPAVILATFDIGRAQQALENRDLAELETVVPESLSIETTSIAVFAAAVLLAILLVQLGAALAQVAATAVENATETSALLLSAADTAYQASPELRGLVILLGVLASIQTLRGRR